MLSRAVRAGDIRKSGEPIIGKMAGTFRVADRRHVPLWIISICFLVNGLAGCVLAENAFHPVTRVVLVGNQHAALVGDLFDPSGGVVATLHSSLLILHGFQK